MTADDEGAEASLRAALAAAQDSVAALERQHADVVATAAASNGDDEHDPEGATIAFERAQVAALAIRARQQVEDLRTALQRLAEGTRDTCELCGGLIGAGRLAARPGTRRCVTCAAIR